MASPPPARTEFRRALVRAHATLNGIDFLEVDPGQTRLVVTLFKPPADAIGPLNLHVDGGDRVRGIRGMSVSAAGNVLIVDLSAAGDFSTYELSIIRGGSGTDALDPPDGYDAVFHAVPFSFKVGCPSDFDCQAAPAASPPPPPGPTNDYLAKDYASFRQLMLDRLSLTTPAWRERNAADVGVVLVELMAYAGDALSYWQDAIAAEAYLPTARRRISLRRHARLVAYRMHEGRSARVWVRVGVTAADVPLAAGTMLLTRSAGVAPRVATTDALTVRDAVAAGAQVFATVRAETLQKAHAEIRFYHWGEPAGVMPAGATSALLVDPIDGDARLRLKRGDVLVLAERLDPDTGRPEFADPTRRHAVRLTGVIPEATSSLSGGQETRTPGTRVVDALTGVGYVAVSWLEADATPFDLVYDRPGAPDDPVSVAWGNLVLSDHGMPAYEDAIRDGDADRFPEPDPSATRPPSARFRPKLAGGPLSWVAPHPFDADPGPTVRVPASACLAPGVETTAPALRLRDESSAPDDWSPVPDLFASPTADAPVFAVEVDDDGLALVRFDEGSFARRPFPGSRFAASYRVGNGAAGNVGADAIGHVVSDDNRLTAVVNPLPAAGGLDPESADEVRAKAPFAYRTPARAVTEDDYARAALTHPDVLQAAATFRWTGSWTTVFVTVERRDEQPVDVAFRATMRDWLEPYRMAGQDLDVDGPRYMPLELALNVCVEPDAFRSVVRSDLLLRLGGGMPGLFRHDRLGFGSPIYLGPILATALAVPGVTAVTPTAFRRQGVPSSDALATGVLRLNRLEIARLDNDPSLPERGVLRLELGGGR